MKATRGKHWLIIGSAATDDPRTHGGVTLLVRQLVEYFDATGRNFDFIQSMPSRLRGKRNVLYDYGYVIFQLLRHIRRADIVMVNVSSQGAYYLAPLVLFITRRFRKQFVFRRFAGNCIELYESANPLRRRLYDYLLDHADQMFYEPKYLIDYFSARRAHVHWFPNVRPPSPVRRDPARPFARRFVFIGQIRKEKGIEELLTAFAKLGNEWTLDLFGTLADPDIDEARLAPFPNVTYRGALHNEKVYETLADYDALLLPSWKEGYPGVIIEAFAVGLPVIASRLPGIEEIVDEECALLVEPKDPAALAEAIHAIGDERYPSRLKAAQARFALFDMPKVYERVIDQCERFGG